MTDLFLKVLNMSFSASWVVLAVVLTRLVLKKAPRSLVCALWAMVALRLVFGGIEAPFSLLPSTQIIPPESLFDQAPIIDSGIPVLDNAVNPIYSESLRPTPGASVNPLQVWLAVFANIWVLGMAAMALWACISCLRVRRQVRESVPDGPVYLCDRISSPFIFGLLRPKIYLPSNLSETARSHVLAHEMAHIARRDHWWKPLGFALLTVNWFNPAMWLSYILLCRDIEMACDERVVRDFGPEEKKAYSAALLSCSVNARPITACPLAFGEVGVKQRIRSVLHYKKPAFWVILLAAVLMAVLALGFLTDPLSPTPEIRFGGILYVQEGRTAKTLPENAEPIGTLRSILHDQPGPGSLHANEDNQAVHLQWEYTGQPMHLSDGTLYIETPGGKGWLPFVQKHNPAALWQLLESSNQASLNLRGQQVSHTEWLTEEDKAALLDCLKVSMDRFLPTMEWDITMTANNYDGGDCIRIDQKDFTAHCLLLCRENDWLIVYRDPDWAVSAWTIESPELDDFLTPWRNELAFETELFAPFAFDEAPIYLEPRTCALEDIVLRCTVPTIGTGTTDSDWEYQAHISHLDGTIQIECRPQGREDWMEIHYRSEAEPLYTYGFQQMPLTLANGATGTLYHGNDPDRWTEVTLDTTGGQLYATAPNPALRQTDWTSDDYRMALAILGTLRLTHQGVSILGKALQVPEPNLGITLHAENITQNGCTLVCTRSSTWNASRTAAGSASCPNPPSGPPSPTWSTGIRPPPGTSTGASSWAVSPRATTGSARPSGAKAGTPSTWARKKNPASRPTTQNLPSNKERATPFGVAQNLSMNGSQDSRLKDIHVKFLRQCQPVALGLGVIESLGRMGVAAQDHVAALLGSHLPEEAIGIMPPLPDTQEIDFERHAAFLRLGAHGPHAVHVELPVPVIVDQVRMGEIGEKPRIHGLHALAAVLAHHLLVAGHQTAVGGVVLIADKMLAQDHIIDGMIPEKFHQLGEMLGIILRLQTDGHFDLSCVLFAHTLDGLHIARQLHGAHPEVGIVPTREQIGRVIRPAQDLQPDLQGLLHIVLLPADGVVAAVGVGMVIGDHTINSF